MNEKRNETVYPDADRRSGTRGFSLPPAPASSGRPMPPVRPPKENGGSKTKTGQFS